MEESDLITYFIFVILALVATTAGYLVYSGLLYSVNILTKKPNFKSLVIGYKFARGPYKECGYLFTEAHSIAPELRTIGIYYDNPQQVPPQSLRYCVGVIFSDADKVVDESVKKAYLDKGFTEFTLPEVDHAVMTEFPFRGTLSLLLGTMKVYPKLTEYIAEKELTAHPMIEIYGADKITYFVPISKQDEFYVPEALEAEEEILQSESDAPVDEGNDDEPADEKKPVNDNGSDSSAGSFEKVGRAKAD